MIDQEEDFLQEIQEQDGGFESGAANRLSMLHLSPAATLQHSTTGISSKTNCGGGLQEKCTNCGSGSTKRQSPSSSSFKEPSSKRATLHLPSAAATTATNHHFPGFTKLPLPHSSPLRRTVSEPIYSSDTVNAAQFSGVSAGQGPILNPPLENGSKSNTVQETVPSVVEAVPHAPAGIYRTISDPTPAVNYHVVTTTTPPRPPATRKFSRSPNCGEGNRELSRRESPNTKMLKKMKERLREMSQWWNEDLHEGIHEDCGSEDNNIDNNLKNEPEMEIEEPAEEAVWVERKGDYLVLHFRCPCGKGYQILLCGNSCYYKLTNF
ncbi:hypothetical protein Fot_52860 [Forsythia ovata]|uniref:Uncharacterized protein n=1 Tax=Forsythia ovata TaxID=205694 RepID=A0ABD1PH11_9LAMI